MRCALCGMFRKVKDLFMAYGEDDEWLECRFCCSQFDLERYFDE